MNDKRPIYFFGDSHVMHMSMNPEVVESQTLARTDDTKWYPPFTIKQYSRDNLAFFSITAHSAFRLTLDIVKEVVGDYTFSSNGIMIFSLGVIDLYEHLPIKKNTESVVKRYMDICYEFCNSVGIECRFQSPFYNLDSEEYEVFIKTLQDYSAELGISAPIIANDNVVPRNYPRADKWNHFDWDVYEATLQYILKEI